MMAIDDILLKRRRKFRLRMLSSTNNVVRYLCDINLVCKVKVKYVDLYSASSRVLPVSRR